MFAQSNSMEMSGTGRRRLSGKESGERCSLGKASGVCGRAATDGLRALRSSFVSTPTSTGHPLPCSRSRKLTSLAPLCSGSSPTLLRREGPKQGAERGEEGAESGMRVFCPPAPRRPACLSCKVTFPYKPLLLGSGLSFLSSLWT